MSGLYLEVLGTFFLALVLGIGLGYGLSWCATHGWKTITSVIIGILVLWLVSITYGIESGYWETFDAGRAIVLLSSICGWAVGTTIGTSFYFNSHKRR
ncbi:MAG: hypothetical protein N2V78_09110 [Methanophagales archaeon]|nr:hypothetical protein [Methanophagales archaeon]